MKQKKKGRAVFSTVRSVAPRPAKTRQMRSEEIVKYIHQAEAYVIPMIQELGLPPAMACFLLAQYTQVVATGDERTTAEAAMTIATTVLTLWQEGKYTPGPAYPYTLEETLQDQQDPLKATQDYAESFRPLHAGSAGHPRGKHQIAAGLVQHPHTQLWQIWFLIDGPCDQLGAYRDMDKAQQGLQDLIALLRKRGTPAALQALCRQVERQSEGVARQIPVDMMQYLLDHLDRYAIFL